MGRMAGKTALVTGAADGIGKAIATRFIEEGARVILTDIQAEKGAESAQELGEGALFLAHDVSSEASWHEVIAKAVEAFGGFDTLVNNAGIAEKGDIEHAQFDHWQRTLRINLDSAYLGMHLSLPILKQAEWASIVNITSAVSVKAHVEMAAYSSSKAGMAQLTRSSALYLARSGYNIRCNVVRPGSVMTPMQERVLAARGGAVSDQMKTTIDAHPMGRIGRPQEIANAVLFLASDEASFVTGIDLAVDGGLTM
ncbi:glucose 1-dehydrogenase [Novosphingobium sp.]|uniref:SDR family NAD(P)-dependent oxidoreductase n=1 Tax=Novosphingobium sp. TaxID=1874826 RepID=UPI00286E6290|nr:glucose 1-dehydrogenase [Novosphingobium sp.]